MYWPPAIIAFALLAMLFFAPILWSRRDELPWRHHRPGNHWHLIPPAPRSYRATR
jgi:hypothetical protein